MYEHPHEQVTLLQAMAKGMRQTSVRAASGMPGESFRDVCQMKRKSIAMWIKTFVQIHKTELMEFVSLACIARIFIYVPLHGLGGYNVFVAKSVLCQQRELSANVTTTHRYNVHRFKQRVTYCAMVY